MVACLGYRLCSRLAKGITCLKGDRALFFLRKALPVYLELVGTGIFPFRLCFLIFISSLPFFFLPYGFSLPCYLVRDLR